ncbi:MAG: hypothetical protein KDA63_00605 [Planctomycetales bacterium]|nr:hypothetical protein [Planctomycetales bacterium]
MLQQVAVPVRTRMALLAVGIVLFAATDSVWAQLPTLQSNAERRRLEQQRDAQAANLLRMQQQLRFSKFSGKIANLQQSAITVDAEGKTYVVQVHPQKTRVTIVGDAGPEVLRTGVLVQFDTLLNPQKTMALEPVEKLLVLTPSPRTQPGVISDTPNDHTLPYTVRGPISRLVGPQMTVAASRKQVRAELGKKPTVQIEVSDTSLVAVGDHVDVEGAEVTPGLVQAVDVRIALSKPVGDKEAGAEAANDRKTGDAANPQRRPPPKQGRSS